MKTNLSRALLAAFLTISLVGANSAVSQAEPTLDRIVSANPADFTPNVNQGKVNSMVQIGTRIIAVGKFTSVTAAASAGGATFTRNGIFAYDATTGVIDTAFVPNVGTAEVSEVVDAGDGTVFIGGAFANVNGAASTARVARINATTGAVITTFKSPPPNKAINDMQLINNKLYIGGSFTKVGTATRTLMAALDPTTGADTGTVGLTFSGTWNGGSIAIKHFDISDNGQTLVAIGNFRNVNGQSRPQIAKIDLTGANQAASLSSWATTRYSTTCGQSFDTYMRDVDIAPNGQYFVVGTTGAYSGGINSGTLCDGYARWELAATGAGQNPSWIDYTGGDTVTQIKVAGNVIYVGGHFRWANNPYNADSAGPGAVPRTGLAAIDPRNGLPTTWDPTRDRGVGVWEFMTTTAGLWVGHDTNRTGKEARKRIALFPVTGGKVLPAENTGVLPGHVFSVGRTNATGTAADVVVNRDFNGTTVASAQSASNGGQTWSQARGATMIDGLLYTGWSDGTLKVRSYNGTTFGAATNVNLYGLTTSNTAINQWTGMFYDKSTARLYYTISGQSRLYYRYFLPESQVLGAARFDGPASGNGINFANTSGMFFDGTRLFVGDSTTGQLRRVGWSGGALSGTASVISGPGTDSQDWRERGSFILAP